MLEDPSAFLALLDLGLGQVVDVQADEGENHAKALEERDVLAEPHDGDADHGDPLDEGGDRVGHWGGPRQDGEG